jgi:hypothetical protein
MTVIELIKELENYDDDLLVVVDDQLLGVLPLESVRQNVYNEVVLS